MAQDGGRLGPADRHVTIRRKILAQKTYRMGHGQSTERRNHTIIMQSVALKVKLEVHGRYELSVIGSVVVHRARNKSHAVVRCVLPVASAHAPMRTILNSQSSTLSSILFLNPHEFIHSAVDHFLSHGFPLLEATFEFVDLALKLLDLSSAVLLL